MIAALSLVTSSALVAAETGSPHGSSTTPVSSSTPDIEESLGYYYGFTIGNMLKAEGYTDISDDTFMAGLRDSVAGKEPALSQAEQEAVINAVRLRREEMKNQQLDELRQEGLNYLADNAKAPGVVQTASGLQYQVITEGTGLKPTTASTVLAHYKGELVNGQVFDDSFARGEPVEFKLTQVIPGWTEGLQLMKAGGRMRFVIPSDLGYGPGGTRNIPPHSVLIFEVELIEVK